MQYIYDDNDDTIYKVNMTQQEFDRNRFTYYMEETTVSGDISVTPMMSDTDVGFALEVEIV